MNRSRLDKRALILAKGSEVMTLRGYHGTGVQEIVAAAGIPKGSFYHYFSSKEDFAIQALAHLYEPRLDHYARCLTDESLSPRERLLRYYRDLLEHFAGREPTQFHCFIGSLSYETRDCLPAVVAQVDAIFQRSVAILQRCLEQAQAVGELAADESCDALAVYIATAWQGVLARLQVNPDLMPMHIFINRLERLLQA